MTARGAAPGGRRVDDTDGPEAALALADGTVWPGTALGARGRSAGEVVFNTSMTGYQEILTDPSYRRQIVVMTAPQIGNTGVNAADAESARAWVAGFAVRRPSPRVSSWRAEGDLDGYLRDQGVVGIAGLDTRALVRHIREAGAMPGAIVSDGGDARALGASAPDIHRMDLVGEVTCAAPYDWTEPADPAWYPLAARAGAGDGAAGPRVVVYDFGVKRNMLRLLVARGCRVTVVPARTPPSEVLLRRPDGVLLSNGPGDPAALGDLIEQVRALLGEVPLFGICLGHQLLGLALGASAYKLKFGHRGGNQPVRDERTGRVAISSHNHGFALARDGLPDDVEVTHVNLNDGCVEGLVVPDRRAFSVQYHPEAGPGPHDSLDLFTRFLEAMAGAPEPRA